MEESAIPLPLATMFTGRRKLPGRRLVHVDYNAGFKARWLLPLLVNISLHVG